MTKKNKFYCKKCGNLIGEYQIEDSLNVSSYCHNYCSMCGEKIDKEKFKQILDFNILLCKRSKEVKKILEVLAKEVLEDEN